MKNLDNVINGDKGDDRVMESSTNITRSHLNPQYPQYSNPKQDHFYFQQKHQEQTKSVSIQSNVKSHNLQSPQHIALLKASTMSPTVAHSSTLPSNINRSSLMSQYQRNGVATNTTNGSTFSNGNMYKHSSSYSNGKDPNVLNNNFNNSKK